MSNMNVPPVGGGDSSPLPSNSPLQNLGSLERDFSIYVELVGTGGSSSQQQKVLSQVNSDLSALKNNPALPTSPAVGKAIGNVSTAVSQYVNEPSGDTASAAFIALATLQGLLNT